MAAEKVSVLLSSQLQQHHLLDVVRVRDLPVSQTDDLSDFLKVESNIYRSL